MRKIISLICLLFPVLVFAASEEAGSVPPANGSDIRLDIRSDAPDHHVVVKGDTLWDIANQFFKDPWKWPHIWNLNKDSIKNPHWIYPGDVVYLDRASGTLQIRQPENGEVTPNETTATTGAATETDTGKSEAGNVTKLVPKIHEQRGLHDAIPSIPAKVIEPFLSRPLIIEENALKDAPVVIGARERRILLGKNETAFVKDLPSNKGGQWQIYRPGKTLIDPDTDETLGVEAIYLGDAQVNKFGDISTIEITKSVLEIYAGDRLVVSSVANAGFYLPRAPETKISAQVISIYGGVDQGGQNSIITLNKGSRDGLEIGHVLALYRKGETVKFDGDHYDLPDERYGLIFVFRVFEKVSYALVMEVKLPVQVLDRANTP